MGGGEVLGKISKNLNTELCCRFVALNLLEPELISSKKYICVKSLQKRLGEQLVKHIQIYTVS